ncbi:exported hypothetical protein [uncultured Mycobacterium sp.]|uniref:Uncharacterized protein n=1 Tax=uncultured Mycobacterium sp. TaxID=171292 RepID=A0A1Y5PL42_9MYCO|nr:exported hypothetical protein [uncultured Mycobacterium sp.]
MKFSGTHRAERAVHTCLKPMAVKVMVRALFCAGLASAQLGSFAAEACAAPEKAVLAAAVEDMSEHARKSQAPSVIPAPPGLTVSDSAGNALPIVALQITDRDGQDAEVVPLDMDLDGSVARLWSTDLRLQLSATWTPTPRADAP